MATWLCKMVAATKSDDPKNAAHFLDQGGIEGIRGVSGRGPVDLSGRSDDRCRGWQCGYCEAGTRHGIGRVPCVPEKIDQRPIEATEGDVAVKGEKVEVVRGSGNVFRDLGHENADAEQFKAILAAEIIKALDREALTVRSAHCRSRLLANPQCGPRAIYD